MLSRQMSAAWYGTAATKKEEWPQETQKAQKRNGIQGAGFKPALPFDPFVSFVPFVVRNRRNF
jgi:hypothetical protein